MSHQLTFADSEFSNKRRKTRKEIFLSRMDELMPWDQFEAVIEPFSPEAGKVRRPYPLSTMFRIHCIAHDPEMHQTQKGKQWFFGLKAHIGVDARIGLTHSLSTTAANVHDITETENLLHGEEMFISADSGYRGAQKREELKDIKADWLIAATYKRKDQAKYVFSKSTRE